MQKEPIKKKRLLGSMGFLLLVTIITFYIIFKDNSVKDILTALTTVNPIFIAIGGIMMLGHVFFQALAIREPLKAFKQRISPWRCIGYSSVGFYFSAITPSSTGGQPMQLYYMVRDHIGVSTASLTLLITNIAYQVTILIYALGMYLLRYSFVNDHVRGMFWLTLYGVIINVALIAIILFVIFSKHFVRKVAAWAIAKLTHFHIIKDEAKAVAGLDRQLQDYADGARIIRRQPLMFARVLFWTVLQMTCLYIIPFLVYKGFGLTGYDVFDLLAVQSILYIAVSFLPLPGGMGATESGFVKLFRIFFDSALIVPAMLLSRFISFYSVLFLSALATLSMHLIRAKPPGDEGG